MSIGMPKIAKPLSAIEVKRLTRVGWHAIGGVAGLLLQIREPATPGAPIPRSWILRVTAGKARQVIGLGPYPQVSIQEARERAAKLATEARQGIDLVGRKRAERSALLASAAQNVTFKACAEAYMAAHATDYRSDKHRKQWGATLEVYAYPIIGNMLVHDIGMPQVLKILLQNTTARDGTTGTFWHLKTETAKRVQGRIKTVLDYATVSGYRTGDNPARWDGFLDTQLGSPNKINPEKHHPALPYADMAHFIRHLRRNPSISAKVLEFLILTGVRSGSVRAATWPEIDFEKKLWVIPAAHTKTGQEHRVPLAPQAIQLLAGLPRMAGTDLIFPSPTGKVLSDMALSQLMRGMRERGELTVAAVPHGFRSTFRDWGAEQTSFPDDIRKAASGHTVGDAVQQAYQRTDLLEKRRVMMNQWANYIDAPRHDSAHQPVVPIFRKRK
jgi:integrase